MTSTITRPYRCPRCRRQWDVECRIADPIGSRCPDCGAEGRIDVPRMAPPVVRFAGGGWTPTGNAKRPDER